MSTKVNSLLMCSMVKEIYHWQTVIITKVNSKMVNSTVKATTNGLLNLDYFTKDNSKKVKCMEQASFRIWLDCSKVNSKWVTYMVK